MTDDYTIRHTPERKTIEATGEGHRDEGEPIGMQIEGHTNFAFTPEDADYTEQDYIDIIERILNNPQFTYGEDPSDPYYRVVSDKSEWSHYHLAVEVDKYIALFVQTATTEESVEEFHNLLEEESGDSWTFEKHETDLNGAGPNREQNP